jgi:DNA mismatch repair protein MutS2
VALHEHDAEVDALGKRLRVKLSDLRLVARAPRAEQPSRVRVEIQVGARDAGPTDLNVIGCSVDEALARAERFLDGALLADQRTLRVIHGHGTGQLRRAIASFLKEHPQVARFELAPPEHGGGGVTIVELKE